MELYLRNAVVIAVAIAILSATCTPQVPMPIDHAESMPVDQTRHYAIWFEGARVGAAIESETWGGAGVHLRRDETMRFLRGDTPVVITTTIDLVADRDLAPSRVTWIERAGRERRGEATRDPVRGWTITLGANETLAITDPAAIPAELAPLVVRRRGRFAGPVFLPARGFVVGHGTIEPVAPGRLLARLAIANGPLALATIDLERDGTQARVVDGEGVIALRTTVEDAFAPWPLVDIIAASSIAVTGDRPRGIVALALDDDPPLPAVPGQRYDHGRVELSARFPGALPPGVIGADRVAEITELVRAVRGSIAPDLGAGPTSSRDAIAATAGDCTTFALAYHALATARAIPTRVVTGLRLDGDHLVRHRWAVSWTGRAWIAVDAAFGEAPAGGELLGLAIHDADDAGLVAGEAALTRVRAARF